MSQPKKFQPHEVKCDKYGCPYVVISGMKMMLNRLFNAVEGDFVVVMDRETADKVFPL